MSKARKIAPIVAALTAIVAITAVASAAISNGGGNIRLAERDDAAIIGSAKIVATTKSPTDGTKWSVRVFHNQRDESCADVGQEKDGELVDRNEPASKARITPGQQGSCVPDGQQLNLAIQRSAEGADPVAVAFGTVGDSVSSVKFSGGGESSVASPQGDERAIVAVVPTESASSVGRSVNDVVDESNKLLAGDGPILIVTFKDGSTLNVTKPESTKISTGSQAAAALAELNGAS